MILENSFYQIIQEKELSLSKYKVTISKDSAIMKAHFPGQPIVPGACLTQIAKELVEKIEKKTITICEFKSLKYINTINPEKVNEIEFSIELIPGEVQNRAQIKVAQSITIFAKFEYIYE
jgi:3-hydroxyacyl-[acyl-carrier-protein] dehydratase